MDSHTPPVDSTPSAPRVIDGLLRGAYTGREQLRAGRIDLPIRTLVFAGVALGAAYGAFMGTFSVMHKGSEGLLQLLASTAKVPLLFFLTLCVTFPSLYVFSALARSSLRVRDTLKLLCMALTVNLAVLASFGPVVAFFALSGPGYPFMVLLNVVFFAASGFIGLYFIRQALDGLFADAEPKETTESVGEGTVTTVSAVPRGASLARLVFSIWLVIFSIVGAQMGWILRPFIGAPALPFALFRGQEDNFFLAVSRALQALFR